MQTHPVCLGMKPPTKLDKIPNLHRFGVISAQQAPAKLDRSKTTPYLIMGANNVLSDCTAVAIPNHINMFLGMDGAQSRIATSTSKVINFYSATTGYSPDIPGSDAGADPTEVLIYATRNGFTTDTGTYYPTFGGIDVNDRNALANTMCRTGGVYGAFALAQADQLAYQEGRPFDTTNPGDQTNWSWGGHLACPYDYTGLGDDDTVRIATWAGLYPATWRWVRARLVGAYGLLWPQLFSPVMATALGADYDKFRTDAQSFMNNLV